VIRSKYTDVVEEIRPKRSIQKCFHNLLFPEHTLNASDVTGNSAFLNDVPHHYTIHSWSNSLRFFYASQKFRCFDFHSISNSDRTTLSVLFFRTFSFPLRVPRHFKCGRRITQRTLTRHSNHRLSWIINPLSMANRTFNWTTTSKRRQKRNKRSLHFIVIRIMIQVIIRRQVAWFRRGNRNFFVRIIMSYVTKRMPVGAEQMGLWQDGKH